MKKFIPFLVIFFVSALLFYQTLLKGFLPIPADDIIGLYHPFRDLYASEYPRGIPFKNSLITDPVRQQYPWKKLVVEAERNFTLPLWNPYNGAGTPLLANFQSAGFYPFNLIFFVMPFNAAWSLLIFLQPLLAGLFLYLYLNNLKLSKYASVLGAITFSFSGFSTAWLEWSNVLHTGLWLPLILFSIDKSFVKKNISIWNIVFLVSILMSFFAGHLQTFFYVSLMTLAYAISKWIEHGKRKRALIVGGILAAVFLIIASVQLLPTLQFISNSARSIDVSWKANNWFIPWQHLLQFIIPDFFGNPATLNYFGIWNYGELIGYVGIVPLIFAIFALFFKRDKMALFFGSAFFLSIIFALPTFIAKIPFQLEIPLLDTAQPTRLLFVVDFSLSILAALGFDRFIKNKKGIRYPMAIFGILFISVWSFTNLGGNYISVENMSVIKHNLIFPTVVFIASTILIIAYFALDKKKIFSRIILVLIIVTVVFDLIRFDLKFNPFISSNYIFPSTQTTSFLEKNIGNFRLMTSDSRMLPPNFSAVYKIQSIDNYDPLYLLRYGEFVAAMERGKPNINPPFGFNRIITPQNYSSSFVNLMGVKYVLSLTQLQSPGLVKVFQEGQTQVYENKNVLPRAFFVKNILNAKSKQDAINLLFDKKMSLNLMAIVEGIDSAEFSLGDVNILDYQDNEIIIGTENSGDGFLILTDSFYPTWHATVDGKETKIYLTDFNFRGIFVPAGKHKVVFFDNLF